MKSALLLFLFLGNLCFCNSQVPSYVPTDSLMGWWPFNGDAEDESVNTNDGTILGPTLTTDRNSIPSAAFVFDGLNDKITVPALDASAGNQLSISVWINPANISTYTYYEIIRQDNGFTGSPDFLLSFQNNGTILSFGVGSGTYSELDLAITSTSYVGTWHHLVAVYNGANRYIYRDAVLLGSGVKTGNMNYTSTVCNFGSSLSSEYFNGKIDDIGIWNRALTEQEISDLFLSSGVGINQTLEEKNITLFPNPTNNMVNLNIGEDEIGFAYKITDQIGKIIYSDVLTNKNTSINFSNYANGIYFLQIENSKLEPFKIIKN